MIPPYLRCLAWLGLLLASTASARPDPDAVLGETLVERGSAFYRFEHFELDSRDSQRHYRARPHILILNVSLHRMNKDIFSIRIEPYFGHLR